MEPGTQDKQLLQTLEENLWKSETRFDMDWMERTLASDFLEFGRSGRVYSRNETLGLESQPIDARLPLENFKARLIGPDVALVTYISAVAYGGVVELGNRSSIWSRTERGWELRFHQGTPTTAQQT